MEVPSCVCSSHTTLITANKQLHVAVNIPRIWLHNATASLCLDVSGVMLSAVYKGRSPICISCTASYDRLSCEYLLTLKWFFIIANTRNIQKTGSTWDFRQRDEALFTILFFFPPCQKERTLSRSSKRRFQKRQNRSLYLALTGSLFVPPHPCPHYMSQGTAAHCVAEHV